jgi:hypothetical protein
VAAIVDVPRFELVPPFDPIALPRVPNRDGSFSGILVERYDRDAGPAGGPEDEGARFLAVRKRADRTQPSIRGPKLVGAVRQPIPTGANDLQCLRRRDSGKRREEKASS